MLTFYADINGIAYVAINAADAEDARTKITRKLVEDEAEGLLERWRKTGAEIRRLVRNRRPRLEAVIR